ncbi:hypothetical protein AB6E04_09570 [Vibrio amylolyticus]|uniref:hypothetical protein n=1 Tax=Vibrio amylolyticus TaxID=2847292 RepID=UPI003553EA03
MNKQDLSKMGAARVSKTIVNGVPCIHKQGAKDVEINFYKVAASNLHGINTPRLIQINNQELFIEYIPNRIALAPRSLSKDDR